MAFVNGLVVPTSNQCLVSSFTGCRQFQFHRIHHVNRHSQRTAFHRPYPPPRQNITLPRMDAAGAGIYAPTTNTSNVRAIIFGATGYIGRYVTFEFIRRGYDVVAFSRPRSGVGGKNGEDKVREDLKGATVMFGDVTNPEDVRKVFTESAALDNDVKSTIVVSCLASRTGGIADSNKIDYEATLNTLREGRAHGSVSHFILLSAVCVQKPELEFQRAKLRFEAELQREASMDDAFSYSIVRPTAFFKSLAGQVKRLKNGSAFIMFGDGAMCKCNALSERDLASFIADCAVGEEKRNEILPVGGPGEPQTPKQQAEMLFNILDKKPKYISLPISIMDFSIGLLDGMAKVLPFPQVQDAAEFGKIGRYYAVEDMVGPSYGSETLEQFFERAVKEGGMEGQDLGDAAII